MKYFKHLSIILLIIIFTSCGFGSNHVTAVPSEAGDHPLVGVWEWTSTDTYLYIFNADGSGSRGTAPAIQQFTWSVCDADHLSMTFNRLTEHWYQEIENDVLTITSRQVATMQYSYNRRAGS